MMEMITRPCVETLEQNPTPTILPLETLLAIANRAASGGQIANVPGTAPISRVAGYAGRLTHKT